MKELKVNSNSFPAVELKFDIMNIFPMRFTDELNDHFYWTNILKKSFELLQGNKKIMEMLKQGKNKQIETINGTEGDFQHHELKSRGKWDTGSWQP